LIFPGLIFGITTPHFARKFSDKCLKKWCLFALDPGRIRSSPVSQGAMVGARDMPSTHAKAAKHNVSRRINCERTLNERLHRHGNVQPYSRMKIHQWSAGLLKG
jgi:hypothetical protein